MSNIDDILGDSDYEDDHDDPALLDKILGESDNEDDSDAETIHTSNTAFDPSSTLVGGTYGPQRNVKEIDNLLRSPSSVSTPLPETKDPLDMVHHKEIEEAKKTDKPLRRTLDFKR